MYGGGGIVSCSCSCSCSCSFAAAAAAFRNALVVVDLPRRRPGERENLRLGLSRVGVVGISDRDPVFVLSFREAFFLSFFSLAAAVAADDGGGDWLRDLTPKPKDLRRVCFVNSGDPLGSLIDDGNLTPKPKDWRRVFLVNTGTTCTLWLPIVRFRLLVSSLCVFAPFS